MQDELSQQGRAGDVREGKPERKCLEHLRRELAIVSPKMIVAMGGETVAALNAAEVPLAREVRYEPGEIAEFTPGTDVLITPDIDQSLDDQRLKAGFWRAFRRLGEWYDSIPPY